MCFLCGNDISLHSYNSLNKALSNLQNSYDKLNEKYEKCINELNETKIKYLAAKEELEDSKLRETQSHEISSFIPGLSSKLSEPNLFGVLLHFIRHLKDNDYTLDDAKKLDDDFSELKDEILNNLDKNKFTDIQVRCLQQRTWDSGKPIKLYLTIDVDYLSKDEVDVLRSLVRNHHSEQVGGDEYSGLISFHLKNNICASVMLDFGGFGTNPTPSISFSTDIYNETWEDFRRDDDEDEYHFMAPDEIFDMLAKLNFEVMMNRWGSLLDMK